MSHLKNELQSHAEQLGFEGYLQQGDFTRLVHRYTDVEDVYLSIKSEGEAIAVKVELKPDNIAVNHLGGDLTRIVLDWSQVQSLREALMLLQSTHINIFDAHGNDH